MGERQVRVYVCIYVCTSIVHYICMGGLGPTCLFPVIFAGGTGWCWLFSALSGEREDFKMIIVVDATCFQLCGREREREREKMLRRNDQNVERRRGRGFWCCDMLVGA